MSEDATLIYGVELLFERAPDLDDEALKKRLGGSSEGAVVHAAENGLRVEHVAHQVRYEEGERPAQTVVLAGEGAVDAGALDGAVEQSRLWPGAREAVARCKAQVLVADLGAQHLHRKRRLALFADALREVVEHTKPVAMRWLSSDALIDPAQFLEVAASAGAAPLAFNVRLYKRSGGEADEVVLDTLGLEPFGLPDLQASARGDAAGTLAFLLHRAALYLFEEGDVIQDGDVIPGATEQERWRVKRTTSLVSPERPALELSRAP
jgi:hypothetical protein